MTSCMRLEPLENLILLNKRKNGCSYGEQAMCRIDWAHGFNKLCRRAEDICTIFPSAFLRYIWIEPLGRLNIESTTDHSRVGCVGNTMLLAVWSSCSVIV